MLKILLKFFMWILQMFSNILLAPFVSAITALFPSISSAVSNVNTFLDYAFTYIITVRDLLLIPSGAMLLFFDYLLIKYSIYLVRLTIKSGIKIYNTFKL